MLPLLSYPAQTGKIEQEINMLNLFKLWQATSLNCIIYLKTPHPFSQHRALNGDFNVF